MSTADILSPPAETPSRSISSGTLLTGVALSSFSALLLELSLTRLFSVVLFYHFAFLAISIALLGLGAGGVFAHLRKTALGKVELRFLAATCALLSACAIPLAIEVVLHTPVALELSAGNFLRLSAIYLASAVPFFLTGLEFSVIFARFPERIPRIYGADLIGGAIACVAVVPLLNWIGGPNTVLFAALATAVAAAVWSPTRFLRRSSATLIMLLMMGVMFGGEVNNADWIVQ